MSHVTCHISYVTAYVDPWDMLNNFCFHVYAQMSLFMGENVNAFFTPTATHEFGVHGAGSQLKMVSF